MCETDGCPNRCSEHCATVAVPCFKRRLMTEEKEDDFQLASIGSPLLDVGWLMMLADPLSWQPDWRPLCPLTPRAIAARCGADPGAMAWWQALAGYRLGSIACLNVHLHRSGRRPDAVWERFALAIPTLFARAQALLRDVDVVRGPEGIR